MRITVTVDQPTGEFQDKLLSLLSEHAATVEIDTTWTLARAEDYYRSLPDKARKILKEAVMRDGYVPADELRDDENASLRGHSAALKRALRRGVMTGKWPENMQPPIEPQGPGFGKVVGYRMPENLVQTFSTAIKKTDESGPVDPGRFNEAGDAFHKLTEIMNGPIPSKRTTEK
ncbi:hypothetical protein [Streptomyces sp. DW26H14]|uniref:hypothetical protein n=1 Tax=Streptomyces sp. DW26H14 TaxID=3435395 RepID=UPI00403E1DB4